MRLRITICITLLLAATPACLAEEAPTPEALTGPIAEPVTTVTAPTPELSPVVNMKPADMPPPSKVTDGKPVRKVQTYNKSKSFVAAPEKAVPPAAPQVKVTPKVQDAPSPGMWGNSPQPPAQRPDKIESLGRSEQKTEEKPAKGALTPGTLLMTFLKLLVVLALAYVTILALKLLSGKKGSLPQSSRTLRVVDGVRLTPNSSLHLVSVKGKSLLVGCANGQVNLLQEFEEDAETAEPSENKFAEYLARYSGPGGGDGPASRIAGLLRDCSAHLLKRHDGTTGTQTDDKKP